MKTMMMTIALLITSAALAQDGPTTPVPPVPTVEEMNEYHWQQVRQIDLLMTECLNRQRLLVYLLEIDPDGPNAAFIRHQLTMERMVMAQLRAQRQWHLDQMR